MSMLPLNKVHSLLLLGKLSMYLMPSSSSIVFLPLRMRKSFTETGEDPLQRKERVYTFWSCSGAIYSRPEGPDEVLLYSSEIRLSLFFICTFPTECHGIPGFMMVVVPASRLY